MSAHDAGTIQAFVARALQTPDRVVLAVSGGVDSMVLLDAAAATLAAERVLVATFDHQSGPHTALATSLVRREAGARGLEVIVGRASPLPRHSEAAWRAARWRFLRDAAAAVHGVVATAHTEDDQIETVFLRALRGSGARGLAGLYADSTVNRPLLPVTRASIERYAAERGLRWMTDPSNTSRAFARNRARLDLLPALNRARPTFGDDLLELSAACAEWRRRVEQLTDTHVFCAASTARAGGNVLAAPLQGFSREALAIMWPVLAARAGVTLDRRGTERAVACTITGRVGSRIQLSGGWTMHRARDAYEIRRAEGAEASARSLRCGYRMTWKEWRFFPASEWVEHDLWTAWLPRGGSLWVRAWRPGDRIAAARGGLGRRVKRYLSDAGISGHARARWPVVLLGDEIVWIPGVRRTPAVTEQPGRQGLAYHCDYHDH